MGFQSFLEKSEELTQNESLVDLLNTQCTLNKGKFIL